MMDNLDQWDDTGAFHYRQIPEPNLAAFFNEERSILTITKEKDGWWLNNPEAMGEDLYPTLDEAKAAGDEIIKAGEDGLELRLLTEAGLSTENWKVDLSDGLTFKHLSKPIEIVANTENSGGTQSWSLFRGDDELVRNVRSLAEIKDFANTL